MVEDIWDAVKKHANIDQRFTDEVSGFRMYDFLLARNKVANAI
jgi:hypothetical protein